MAGGPLIRFPQKDRFKIRIHCRRLSVDDLAHHKRPALDMRTVWRIWKGFALEHKPYPQGLPQALKGLDPGPAAMMGKGAAQPPSRAANCEICPRIASSSAATRPPLR